MEKEKNREREKKLTTAAGTPVPDNRNAGTAGLRGSLLLQDVGYTSIPESKYDISIA